MSVAAEKTWPADGIERLDRCPLCASEQRHVEHEGLTDEIFFAAPGRWDLWRCETCRCTYLDPRPNPATIGLAYETYYTHNESEPPPPRSALQRLRTELGNGYRNRRFGTTIEPALSIGGWLGRFLPPVAWPVNVAYRFLPRRASAIAPRVLDIGCGNGEWLRLARKAGWSVAGVEPDPVSSDLARRDGIEVRAATADWSDEPAAFDFITMSHVIEHVHDPVETLRVTHSLLKPGGGIFIDTPNIDSDGHARYQRHWRGLEPPRHLVMFNRESLERILLAAGFTDIDYRARFFPVAGMDEQSRRIAAGIPPYEGDLPDSPWSWPNVRSAFAGSRAEFLTLTARKA